MAWCGGLADLPLRHAAHGWDMPAFMWLLFVPISFSHINSAVSPSLTFPPQPHYLKTAAGFMPATHTLPHTPALYPPHIHTLLSVPPHTCSFLCLCARPPCRTASQLVCCVWYSLWDSCFQASELVCAPCLLPHFKFHETGRPSMSRTLSSLGPSIPVFSK